MAVRATSQEVQDTLSVNYDGERDLEGVIITASLLVDRVVACAVKKGITLTTAEQLEIEKYVAAHIYGFGDQFYTSRSTQGASGSFQGQFAMSLESSHYGQLALTLDHSGCLRALSSGKKAEVFWLGTRARNITRTGGY